MEVITDFPERLKKDVQVYVGARYRAMIIQEAQPHPDGLLITFVGVDSPEAAGELRRQAVYVRAADRPALPSGMYYHHELIGFKVVNEKDEPIGTLREILQTGANDVYIVSSAQGDEVLIPAIASVVVGIERENRQIRIREMPGLLSGSRGRPNAS